MCQIQQEASIRWASKKWLPINTLFSMESMHSIQPSKIRRTQKIITLLFNSSKLELGTGSTNNLCQITTISLKWPNTSRTRTRTRSNSLLTLKIATLWLALGLINRIKTICSHHPKWEWEAVCNLTKRWKIQLTFKSPRLRFSKQVGIN